MWIFKILILPLGFAGSEDKKKMLFFNKILFICTLFLGQSKETCIRILPNNSEPYWKTSLKKSRFRIFAQNHLGMSPPLHIDDISWPNISSELVNEEVLFEDNQYVTIEEINSDGDDYDPVSSKNIGNIGDYWRNIPISITEIHSYASWMSKCKMIPSVRTFQFNNTMHIDYYMFQVIFRLL